MANPEHLELLTKGVAAVNAWRATHSYQPLDLAMANLGWARLDNVDLHHCNLSNAFLKGTKFAGANLHGADLAAANLTETDLRSADLSGANLRSASFHRTLLNGCNMADANMYVTLLAALDLSDVKGLDAVQHAGPSTVGIDTIHKSLGKIPEVFLLGCGVPEAYLRYARGFGNQAQAFYSCFINYSSRDHEFAQRLHAALIANQLRCWFAPEDLKIGDRFQERIEESIELFDKVLIVLSSASVKSHWVQREVDAARERAERENRSILFPIRVDDAVLTAAQPWAADIRRTSHIGDFSAWQTPTGFQTALERLLRDLRTSEAVSA